VLERVMQGPQMDMKAYLKRIQDEQFKAHMRGEPDLLARIESGEFSEQDQAAMDRIMKAGDAAQDEAALGRVMAKSDPKQSAASLDRVMQGLDYPRQLSAGEKSSLQKMISEGVVPLAPEQKITGDEYADTAAIAEYLLSQRSAESAFGPDKANHPLSHDPLFGLSSEHTRNSPVFDVYRKDTVLPQYRRFYQKLQPLKDLNAR